MDRLSANFYPAENPVPYSGKTTLNPETGEQTLLPSGEYIGKAKITVGNAYRFEDISVFRQENGNISLNFPDYPAIDSTTGNSFRVDYVRPLSPEAWEAAINVVEDAIRSESGFAFTPGSFKPELKIVKEGLEDTRTADGNKVIADARFNIEIGDMFLLRSVTTRPVEHEYEAEGGKMETNRFIAVDIPNALDKNDRPSQYTKDGHTRYNKVMVPLISTWTTDDGKKHSFNHRKNFNITVLTARKKLIEAEKTKTGSLDKALDNAKKTNGKKSKQKKAPEREPEMSM